MSSSGYLSALAPMWHSTFQRITQRENYEHCGWCWVVGGGRCWGTKRSNYFQTVLDLNVSRACAEAKAATTLEITLSSFWGIKPLSAVAVRCPFAISLRLSGISVACNYSKRSKLGNCPLKNHSNYLCLCVARSCVPFTLPLTHRNAHRPTAHWRCISPALSSPDLRPPTTTLSPHHGGCHACLRPWLMESSCGRRLDRLERPGETTI